MYQKSIDSAELIVPLPWTPQFIVCMAKPYTTRHLVPFSIVEERNDNWNFLLYVLRINGTLKCPRSSQEIRALITNLYIESELQ